MSSRSLRASVGQIARARLIYEMHATLSIVPAGITSSRHVGGDRGGGPWERLPVEVQEHFVRIGDAVAKLALEQARVVSELALEKARNERAL
jgi:hypothetical protein